MKLYYNYFGGRYFKNSKVNSSGKIYPAPSPPLFFLFSYILPGTGIEYSLGGDIGLMVIMSIKILHLLLPMEGVVVEVAWMAGQFRGC